MKAYQNIKNNYDAQMGQNVLDSILNDGYITTKQTLESLEHRIAERKKLEYKNIQEMETQRKKIEEAINTMQCFDYNPNPKLTMVTSKLGTEMVKIELKKGEEAVDAFRDVERLEAEKRKILEEMRSEETMASFSGGYT
tara:strand:- start:755 stop:1171 length:417 start_codon:yes stop_codon:yes gene_type:complete